jgi:hypothetical protein
MGRLRALAPTAGAQTTRLEGCPSHVAALPSLSRLIGIRMGGEYIIFPPPQTDTYGAQMYRADRTSLQTHLLIAALSETDGPSQLTEGGVVSTKTWTSRPDPIFHHPCPASRCREVMRASPPGRVRTSEPLARLEEMLALSMFRPNFQQYRGSHPPLLPQILLGPTSRTVSTIQ